MRAAARCMAGCLAYYRPKKYQGFSFPLSSPNWGRSWEKHRLGRDPVGPTAMKRCSLLSPSSSNVCSHLILYLCGQTSTRAQLSGQVLEGGPGWCQPKVGAIGSPDSWRDLQHQWSSWPPRAENDFRTWVVESLLYKL